MLKFGILRIGRRVAINAHILGNQISTMEFKIHVETSTETSTKPIFKKKSQQKEEPHVCPVHTNKTIFFLTGLL